MVHLYGLPSRTALWVGCAVATSSTLRYPTLSYPGKRYRVSCSVVYAAVRCSTGVATKCVTASLSVLAAPSVPPTARGGRFHARFLINRNLHVLTHGGFIQITQSILTHDRDSGRNSHNPCVFDQRNCDLWYIYFFYRCFKLFASFALTAGISTRRWTVL